MWYNNEIIKLYFNCKKEVSTSVPPLYTMVALPIDSRNYWPKHVVAIVVNK